MAKILKPSGTFYLSTPIGKERVEFNANWVFDPRSIVNIAKEAGLELKGLTVFNSSQGARYQNYDETALTALAQQHYNLGIFTFNKIYKEVK